MGTSTVLLLSEATVLAMVALAAIVVVALVVLALVVLTPHGAIPTAPPNPVTQPIQVAPAHVVQSLPSIPVARHVSQRVVAGGRTLEIDVPTKHVDDFMTALRASGWRVHETGEVVATDEDEEGLTTILVDMPNLPSRAATGEEVR